MSAIKRASTNWIRLLTFALFAFAVESTLADTNGTLAIYHFQLTRGAGTAVCDAYLLRLNSTKFSKPPYCGRPESVGVPGFDTLVRTPLSSQQIYPLYQRILRTMALGNQGTAEQDIQLAERPRRLGIVSPIEPFDTVNQWITSGRVVVWGYKPAVQIENNNVDSELIIWQGMPLSSDVAACGDGVTANGDVTLTSQAAFFLTSDQRSELDVASTKRVFGRTATQRSHSHSDSKGLQFVGGSIGIFKFQNAYYFDTFLAPKYPTAAHAREPRALDTLGIFLNKYYSTQKICEYKMESSRSKNE